jgi:hypothetical protein
MGLVTSVSGLCHVLKVMHDVPECLQREPHGVVSIQRILSGEREVQIALRISVREVLWATTGCRALECDRAHLTVVLEGPVRRRMPKGQAPPFEPASAVLWIEEMIEYARPFRKA